MSGDVSRICGIIAHDLARTHVSYYNGDSKRTKGMYRQRTQKAWGHTAHRGWARLLLDRARDLIIYGPAHRCANGTQKTTALFSLPHLGHLGPTWVYLFPYRGFSSAHG